MKKVTISNMLEMLVLADMYKAPDLREATKYEIPRTLADIIGIAHLPQEPYCCQLKRAFEEETVEGKAEGVRPSGL